MATLNWTGAASATWGTAGNWIDEATGLPPASAPTAADDCRFGVGTGATNNNCSINAGSVCRSWTVDGYTGTITHNNALVIGDGTAGLSNYAINFVTSGWTYTLGSSSVLTTVASTSGTVQSIRSNGKSFGAFTVNGSGSSYLLYDDFVCAGVFTHAVGTFDTNEFNVTSLTWTTQAGVKHLIMDNTTWTLTSTATATVWFVQSSTNLTITANDASRIVIANASASARTVSMGTGFSWGVVQYTVAGSTGGLSITMGTGTSLYDLEFSDASNARTCTITNATNIFRSPTALNSFRGTSGNLMSLVSNSAGTQRVISRTGKGQTDTDYVAMTDIRFAEAMRWFMGANSTASNTLNGTLAAKPVAPLPTQSKYQSNAPATSSSTTFDNATESGQLLIWAITTVLDPGTVTPPTGFTLSEEYNQTTAVYTKVYHKIADGTEANLAASWTNSVNNDIYIGEYDGFTGTPTLDVTDKNNSAAATSLVSGAGVSNTTNKAVAINVLGGNGALGNSTFATPPTNDFQEHYEVTNGRMRLAILALTAAASRSTTQTWTTSRLPASVFVIFADVAASTDYTQSLSDSVTPSDATAKSVVKALADTQSVVDAVLKSLGIYVSDGASASEAIAKAIGLLQADSSSPNDSAANYPVKSIADMVNVLDEATPVISGDEEHFTLSIGDLVVVSDNIRLRLNGRRLWYQNTAPVWANRNTGDWYEPNPQNWQQED
jgi:hypothetical protein